MVANWSTGAAWPHALFLLIPVCPATAEPSLIKALPQRRAGAGHETVTTARRDPCPRATSPREHALKAWVAPVNNY